MWWDKSFDKFKYISEKILDSNIEEYPFKHVVIEDLLSKEHLDMILNDSQIHFDEVENTKELIETLFKKNYAVQTFPGCIVNPSEYIERYEKKDFPIGKGKDLPIEAFGMTFRLTQYNNPLIKELVEYMNGMEFKDALVRKFDLKFETNIVTAIQKNLSHYEISPHPDVREKGLTYLLNINKDSSIDDEPVHTHLLKFKKEWEFIYDYWKTNLSENRCWVPWDWCDTAKMTNKNNSIVIFSPDVDTLHGVKLNYDHTKFQRTQLYGNLMGIGKVIPQMNWRKLEAMNAR
tara:strand:- start:329 stop:1195 length:867 start_codon:yes stop_codon:yes gene_type:complete